MSQGDARSDVDEREVEENSEDVDDVDSNADVGRRSQPAPIGHCTLKTLIDDQVLDPGDNLLSLEYMGTKFMADLMPNGMIRWDETKQLFPTPSSWVNHCKRIVNPDNSGKTGSAWSTIRYAGKRLDSYKLRWYRRQKKDGPVAMPVPSAVPSTSSTPLSFNPATGATKLLDTTIQIATPIIDDDPVTMRARKIMEHQHLPIKSASDINTSIMVKCTLFSAIERIQPFTMTISTNALLLIDFHCHLTTGEVVGYLGGSWDQGTQNLAILQAFPCRARLGQHGSVVEEEIKQNLEQRHLSLVGWYHSHAHSAPQPTIKDLESQMEYQIALKGETDQAYVPCVGLICSPYDAYNDGANSSLSCFWVMPPPEYRPFEFGKPMSLIYSVTRDSFLTQDLLLEMRLLAHFYITLDAPDLASEEMGPARFWEKLKTSLGRYLPLDLQRPAENDPDPEKAQVQQQALAHFWSFLEQLVAKPQP